METQNNKLHNAILSHLASDVINNIIERDHLNPNELSSESFSLGENITPLILACTYSNIEVVNTLIRYGADVNLVNAFGETPLLHAVWNCKDDIVDVLIENQANVNKIDVYGRSPLYYACQKGNEKIVEILINHNAQVNLIDNAGKSILSRAVCWGNYDIVKKLLNHNVKILDIDIKEGIEFQQKRIVELLEKEKQVQRCRDLGDLGDGKKYES